jgi:hypothetical protein
VIEMPTVFLSYAHDDNRVPDGLKGSGWVSFFDNSLRIELDERGMIDVKVWRDKRDFNTMDVVVNTLDAGVTSSDVFMPVVSPLYVKKQYTMFELDGFVKHKCAGGGSDARRNILMVLKRPVPADQYPPAIRGMGYIPFFEIDREKGQDEPFFKGYASTAPSDKYWDAIREVAKNLQQFFAEMADRAAAKQREQAAAATTSATIYLAQPSNDLSDAHWSLRKELESQGCRIVPSDPWPGDSAAAEKHLRDALADAQLSIHLLGAAPGNDSSSGLAGLARLQLDLAAQRGADDAAFRRLIWLPDRLTSADPAQKELIASLEKGEGLRAQDELVRSGAEGFKEVVRDELARLAGTAAKPSRVYLICDAVDETEALALRPRLVEAGFEVELPEFGPGGTVPAEEHQRCLTGCETVLLFWGQITEGRIRARLEEIDGAIATLRQGARFAARGLYLAPPPSPRKANFASNYVDVILRDPGEFKLLRSPKARRAGP